MCSDLLFKKDCFRPGMKKQLDGKNMSRSVSDNFRIFAFGNRSMILLREKQFNRREYCWFKYADFEELLRHQTGDVKKAACYGI